MGAIILSEEEIDHINYRGTNSENLTAGQIIKVESTPGGIEMLNETVPIDKKWTVQVWVIITETDA